MLTESKPFDVVVIKGKPWSITEGVVMWRSLSDYAHCFIVYDDKFGIYDANTDGFKKQTIDAYRGRDATVMRLRDQEHVASIQDPMLQWLDTKWQAAKGYDYLSWLGFATGIRELRDENRWFCSELPYWLFMEHGFQLTSYDITFMYPSYFVQNAGFFEVVYDGIL